MRCVLLLAVAGLLTGCLSSAGALPPVRWFDPLPAATVLPAGEAVRVAQAPHLGREFVVRVAARELAFDSQHQWVAEPRDLVAAALAGVVGTDTVYVTAFELDVTAAPRAVVRLLVTGRDGLPRVVESTGAASDRSPAAFAEAMAAALADAAAQLGPR